MYLLLKKLLWHLHLATVLLWALTVALLCPWPREILGHNWVLGDSLDGQRWDSGSAVAGAGKDLGVRSSRVPWKARAGSTAVWA